MKFLFGRQLKLNRESALDFLTLSVCDVFKSLFKGARNTEEEREREREREREGELFGNLCPALRIIPLLTTTYCSG